MHNANPLPLTARRSGPLTGTTQVPGDKSISQRALILGALAAGETVISGLLESGDVHSTAGALCGFGATLTRIGPGNWRVQGTGVGNWQAPGAALDFGNSGTGSRLVMGAMATTPIAATFTGDASLRKRPMKRVLDPLTKLGATYDNATMPLTVTGGEPSSSPICSPSVKSSTPLPSSTSDELYKSAPTTPERTWLRLHPSGKTFVTNVPLGSGAEVMTM